MEEFVGVFVQDGIELLDELESLLLQLEHAPSCDQQELLPQVTHCLHSLKGASGYFKVPYLSECFHCMENYFFSDDEDQKFLFPKTNDLNTVFKAIDVLKDFILDLDALEEHEYQQENIVLKQCFQSLKH